MRPAIGLLLAALSLAPAASLAGEDAPPFETPRVGIHIASHHWPDIRANGIPYNNFNPGVELRWSSGVTVGAFRNSLERDTVYAGWTWTSGACAPALLIGVATGYRHRAQLAFTPSICVFNHLRLTLVPRSPQGGNATALHASLEF